MGAERFCAPLIRYGATQLCSVARSAEAVLAYTRCLCVTNHDSELMCRQGVRPEAVTYSAVLEPLEMGIPSRVLVRIGEDSDVKRLEVRRRDRGYARNIYRRR